MANFFKEYILIKSYDLANVSQLLKIVLISEKDPNQKRSKEGGRSLPQ